ncbi:MAG TPA: CHASE domain-containing protein, partial [Algoriphagus sp.]|nr:CHASE domain-containing protein [Algoriphagus sp.]
MTKIKDWILLHVYSSPRLTGWLVFLFSLSVILFFSFVEYKLKLSAERELVNFKLNEFENLLSNALNDGISASKTLGFFAQNQEDVIQNFENIGKQILESNTDVDVIQYLDSGTIVAVYPLAGNEIVIGYNVLKDSTNNKEVQEAIRRNDVYFSGPINLRQGGKGIVGRYPLFEGDKLKGLSAVIIDFNKLFEKVSQSENNKGDFVFQLSKVNPNTQLLEEFGPNTDIENLTGHKASV